MKIHENHGKSIRINMNQPKLLASQRFGPGRRGLCFKAWESSHATVSMDERVNMEEIFTQHDGFTTILGLFQFEATSRTFRNTKNLHNNFGCCCIFTRPRTSNSEVPFHANGRGFCTTQAALNPKQASDTSVHGLRFVHVPHKLGHPWAPQF